MIHGGIPKTRITHRRNDSKKGLLLSMTLVLFIIGALAIMMFTGGEDNEIDPMDTSNNIITPGNDEGDEFSDSSNGGTETIGNAELTSEDAANESESENVPDFFIHVIKSGENFTVLAKKYYNDTRKVHVIVEANPNVNPKRIQVGDKIKVPNLNKNRTNESTTETNTSSNTNSSETRKNNGLSGWKKSTSPNESKKSSNNTKHRPSHPFGQQEQPSVPDDENVGTLVKVIIREKTTHIASPGDSAIGLALQYYGSYNLKTLIEKANPLFDWYNIKGGERIVIPEYSEMKVKSPKPEKDMSQRRDESAGEPISEESSKRKESSEFEVYTVKKGDRLWVIAQKKLGNGTRYREIMKLNNMTSDVVNEGMRIKIPKR